MGMVLGVDGGNSKTIALVAGRDGAIVGYGRGGNSDLYGAGSAEKALAALDEAVRGALARSGIEPEGIDSAAFSMAGADWPEDMTFLEQTAWSRGYGRRALVVNDALGALRAGSPDGTGVSVVCGTGAATGARGPDGRTWHSGWWQEPQGSLHLGEKALRAVYREELGIDPPTDLTRRVLEIFECDTVEDVLHARTRRSRDRLDRRDVVARALLEEADGDDGAAHRLVREHGASLGDYAAAAARKVGIGGQAFTLVLSGGVFRHSGRVLADALIARVQETSPRARPVISRFEPAIGALLLAIEAAGAPVDSRMLERVTHTLPAAALFST